MVLDVLKISHLNLMQNKWKKKRKGIRLWYWKQEVACSHMQYDYFLIYLRIRLQLRTYGWLVIAWSSDDLELWHCTPTHLGKTELIFEASSSKVLSHIFVLERNVKGLKTISQFSIKLRLSYNWVIMNITDEDLTILQRSSSSFILK